MAKKVVLAGACRTAIGKMGGALSNTPAADLGAIVIKEALNRAGVKPEMVDEVKMGCVIQAAQGQNVARQASIKAGLPIEVPAITINVVCGSGLKCVNDAATMIMAGEADIVVAGGMENMSMAPYAMTKARFGYRMNNATIIDTMVNDALTDAFNHYHMMITAENVAEQWGITREELDAFSANSQQKCEKAMAEGKFKDEIVPVEVKQRKQTVIVDTDEGPRAGTTAESLSKLRCCSGKPDGVVTAGNASGINDGDSSREIEPYYLIFQWSSWYVWGFCRLRKDFRMFKLNRMDAITLTEKEVEKRDVPMPDLSTERIFPGGIMVKAVFEPSMKWHLIEEFGVDSFQVQPDGTLLFEHKYTDKDSLIAWMLTCRDQVTVLEPEDVREELFHIANNIAKKYGGDQL